MSNKRQYQELFDYHSASELPERATRAIVFGRNDATVAHAYVDLAEDDLVRWGVITGGVGKDSAGLSVPEAEYLAREAEKYAALRNVDLPPTFLETQASNGGENVRNSFDLIRRGKLGIGALIAVAHATSLRRLSAMVEHEADTQTLPVEKVYRKPSAYQFDVTNPLDQKEAVAEMMRLVEWPDKGWLKPGSQHDLPENLVDFAQDVSKQSS